MKASRDKVDHKGLRRDTPRPKPQTLNPKQRDVYGKAQVLAIQTDRWGGVIFRGLR